MLRCDAHRVTGCGPHRACGCTPHLRVGVACRKPQHCAAAVCTWPQRLQLTLVLARSSLRAALSSLSMVSADSAMPQSRALQISSRVGGSRGRCVAACRMQCRQAAARQLKLLSCTCRYNSGQTRVGMGRRKWDQGAASAGNLLSFFLVVGQARGHVRTGRVSLCCPAAERQVQCSPLNIHAAGQHLLHLASCAVGAGTYLEAATHGPVDQQHCIMHQVVPQ